MEQTKEEIGRINVRTQTNCTSLHSSKPAAVMNATVAPEPDDLKLIFVNLFRTMGKRLPEKAVAALQKRKLRFIARGDSRLGNNQIKHPKAGKSGEVLVRVSCKLLQQEMESTGNSLEECVAHTITPIFALAIAQAVCSDSRARFNLKEFSENLEEETLEALAGNFDALNKEVLN